MLPEYLYHVTAKKNLPSIRKVGLRPGAYLSALPELTSYYAETIRDEGEVPQIFKIAVKDLDLSKFEPDHPGLEEPILTVVRAHMGLGYECDEDWVYGKWVESEQDFEASLSLIGSVRYAEVIPAQSLNLAARKPSAPNHDPEPGF